MRPSAHRFTRPVVWAAWFLLVPLAASHGRAQPAEGLIAHWPFDEGSGNIVHDTSGYANDGFRIGADWVPGLSGTALAFFGTDEVHIPKSFDDPISSSMTVSAWACWSGSGTGSYVFDARTDDGAGFILLIEDPTFVVSLHVLQPYGPGTVVRSARIMPVGQWLHLLGVLDRDAETLSIYMCGALEGSVHIPHAYYNSWHFAAIGNNHWTGEDRPMNGVIEEVRIYNRALSEEEIQELYEWGGTEPSAVELSDWGRVKVLFR